MQSPSKSSDRLFGNRKKKNDPTFHMEVEKTPNIQVNLS